MEDLTPPRPPGAPGLLEWFWEVRPGSTGASRLLSGGRSCLVLVDEATVDDGLGLLLYLLHQIYRCQQADMPIQWVGEHEAATRLAGGRISRVEGDVCQTALQRRLKELGGGRPSVVVMQEPGGSAADEPWETLGFDVLRLTRRADSRSKGVAMLSWVFGNLVAEDPPIDPAARELENLFVERLRAYQWRVDPRHRRRSAIDPELESAEHYWLKMYIAWLHRKDRITVEAAESRGADRERISDIRVEEGPIYYEVETLYSSGDPVAKLNETLDKYAGTEEVRIVIPNVQAMLFLGDLLRAESVFRRDKNVSFWTTNLSRTDKTDAVGEQGLALLREIAARVSHLRENKASPWV